VRHLHILCEGQTEEIIARDVMGPHFVGDDAWVTWSIFTTKRPAGGPAFKGGLSTWPKLERELQRLLRDSSTTVLTTMFDYYAFPPNAPGMTDRPHGSPYERVGMSSRHWLRRSTMDASCRTSSCTRPRPGYSPIAVGSAK
jgi:hypothetical protein